MSSYMGIMFLTIDAFELLGTPTITKYIYSHIKQVVLDV
jgi:hypothetical protein